MRTCGSAPGPSSASALSSWVRPEWPSARSIRAATVRGARPDVIDRRPLVLERLPGARELAEIEQELRLVIRRDRDPDRLPVAVRSRRSAASSRCSASP